MNKQDIISFFDNQAQFWDAQQIRNEEIIDIILCKGGVREGVSVLDVACGTGVLFSDYEKRRVSSVTAIDISPEMVNAAKKKFPEYDIICADAEDYCFGRTFDTVMIYNAFPHFSEPEKLIKNLAKSLNKGGRLSIAHGASREEIEKCHSGIAKSVSLPLPCKEELAALIKPYFEVDIMISDSHMYMVSGVRKL